MDFDRAKNLISTKGRMLERDFIYRVYDLEKAIVIFRTHMEKNEMFWDSEIRELLEKEEHYSQVSSSIDPFAPFLSMISRALKTDVETEYLQLFRGSFLISMYSFVESQLIDYTYFLGGQHESKVNNIEEAKDYLVKEVKINYDFGKSLQWSEIQDFRRLRNCLVHYRAYVSRLSSTNKQKLITYIERSNNLLSLKNEKVHISRGYSEHVIDIIDDFCWSVLASECDRFLI